MGVDRGSASPIHMTFALPQLQQVLHGMQDLATDDVVYEHPGQDVPVEAMMPVNTCVCVLGPLPTRVWREDV